MERQAPLRRLALLVEYQGTAYGGSQYQVNAPTVQGALERALSSLTGESLRVALAGRTDAGVHAAGQVAAFSTRSRHGPETMARALNAHLPADIAVRAVQEAPLDFDPRRQARSRWYRYTLYTGRQRPALARHFAWHVRAELDEQAMEKAAGMLIGGHDFAPFTAPSEARRRATQRLVTRSGWSRRGELLRYDVEANAFLLHMVRRIVGALVDVGTGRRQAADMQRLLQSGAPGEASRTAPARGLCLMKVRYEGGIFEDEKHEDI